jgi:ABC-type transport system involved in Fe-S cluster assembly fused permease/ATPase subunit
MVVDKRNKISSMTALAKYLWPDDLGIRLRVIFSMICLVLGKAVAMMIPVAYKYSVDGLSAHDKTSITLFAILIAYGLARISSQAFNELRDGIFARVGQRAIRVVALSVFRHVHDLSMRFHVTRKTGGLSRSIERGTNGIESILRYSLYNIIPTLFEIVMVCFLLWYVYDFVFALVTFSTMVCYVAYTLFVSEWRVSFVRKMNELDNQASTKAVDSMLNFETVKYFCNEDYEAKRFNESLIEREDASVKNSFSLSVLNIGQGIIISLGLVIVMILAMRGIQNHIMTVGDFVLLNAYLIQLSIPLNMLGFAYREIKSAIINMDDMFKLLDIPLEIQDKEDAEDISVSSGIVAFENVGFAYNPDREILKDISFTIDGGKTLAIVGESGAGKSTISRLLFRFYDVTNGRITIDGQDIRDVTQKSVRSVIGIVPQDTVLFNDTIYHNIAYGNSAASQEEVIKASKYARIHDFVMSLPQAYDTVVGERGLKLSGGEKQRVAIARTILKNPQIYVFDEATSALDTNTEKAIQSSLQELSAHKTTLIIAHRLSTIIGADEIIVIDGGQIVERGTHRELLGQMGRYARLWERQQEELRPD